MFCSKEGDVQGAWEAAHHGGCVEGVWLCRACAWLTDASATSPPHSTPPSYPLDDVSTSWSIARRSDFSTAPLVQTPDCQLVGTLVIRVSGVALDPVPLHLMPVHGGV